jgi:hypothetical protein
MRTAPDWRLLVEVTVNYRWDEDPGVIYTTRSAYSLQESSGETRANDYLEARATPEGSP